MGLFNRTKKIEPTTVSEAIQPFRDVQAGLLSVMERSASRKKIARERMKSAKLYAETVEQTETEAADAAQKELDQAEKIANALAALLGEDAIVTSGLSMTAADRAKKMGSARASGTDEGEGLRKGPDA
jgi:hypothetical protein